MSPMRMRAEQKYLSPLLQAGGRGLAGKRTDRHTSQAAVSDEVQGLLRFVLAQRGTGTCHKLTAWKTKTWGQTLVARLLSAPYSLCFRGSDPGGA